MPVLNMYIGKMLISSVEINHEGLNNLEEREKYNQRLVEEMLNRHQRKILFSRMEPEFFIENVESKMNNQNY